MYFYIKKKNQKKTPDSEEEAKIEKMKRCVFTVPQPIHYVGVEKGMHTCEWLNSLRMLVRHSLTNAVADPAHNCWELEWNYPAGWMEVSPGLEL